MERVYWLILGAAIIHVLEEYRTGFLDWFSRFAGRTMPVSDFVVINTLFLLLCLIAALASGAAVLRLSVAGLLMINAFLHLGGSIRARRRAPGVVSAVLLYLPLAAVAFYDAARTGDLAWPVVRTALLLTVLWQATPLLLLLFRRPASRADHPDRAG